MWLLEILGPHCSPQGTGLRTKRPRADAGQAERWKEPGSLEKSLSHRTGHLGVALPTAFLFYNFTNIPIVSAVELAFPVKL